MHSSSQVCGMMVTGLFLLSSSVAIAQSSAPSSRLLNDSSQPAPAVSNRLICDSSGVTCVAAGKHGTSSVPVATTSPPAVKPTPASSPSVAAGSPSRNGFQEVQQSPASAPRPLICDATGDRCAPGSANPAAGAISGGSPLASRTPLAPPGVTSPPPNPYVGQPGPAADNGIPPTPRGSLDQAAQIPIDGAGSYYDGARLVSNDPLDWAVHAYKSQHRLEVYFKGRLYKTYHTVFGRSLASGAKLWAGDRRTPEGNYLIIEKHRSARFVWFLRINYPNERDYERFEYGRAVHLIPASAHEGGQIGIHGTDSPLLNVSDFDWTTGCISVDNSDIMDLARLLPVGTLVTIDR